MLREYTQHDNRARSASALLHPPSSIFHPRFCFNRARLQSPLMSPIQKHLRHTFLAGIFAAIPLGATIFIVWYVEQATRQPLRRVSGIDIPFVGIIVAIALIYVLGLIVSSLIGRLLLRLIDAILLR